jgi:hypothetical protein
MAKKRKWQEKVKRENGGKMFFFKWRKNNEKRKWREPAKRRAKKRMAGSGEREGREIGWEY